VRVAGHLLLFGSIICGSMYPLPATAQATGEQGIEIGADRLLSEADAPHPVVEPHVSAHPSDPGRLFVSALTIKTVRPYDMDCSVFSSATSGEHWTGKHMGFPICGNPWSTILPSGAAAFTALAEQADVRRYQADMHVYRSAHGDAAGTTPLHRFAAGFDYPKIAYDATRNNLYVIGSRIVRTAGIGRSAILVARSQDGGVSFVDTTLTTVSDANMEVQTPVVLSDGSLLVPYTEHGDMAGNRFPTARSWMLHSRDGGRTFARPWLIAEGCNQRLGWAQLARDASSGPRRDRVYWLCARQDMPGLWLRYSDSAGAAWSDWIRVDGGRLPGAAVVPAMAVNMQGTIGVMWLQRTGEEDPCSLLYFTASTDHGLNFGPPVQLSSVPSCPARDPRNAAAHAHRRLAGGDYNGLAAAADGAFHLVWADARSGIYRLHHATAVVRP
jgi:hypothetical protein